MKRETLFQFILLLSIIGLVVAGYQTYEHYYLGSSICDVSESFSCSVVTESRYGEFPQRSGIAVSFYGLLWWVGLIFLTLDQLWNRGWLKRLGLGRPDFYTFLWLVGGLFSILYMLYVELVALPAQTGELVICPFCTVQHVLIVILFITGFFILEKPLKEHVTDIFYTET